MIRFDDIVEKLNPYLKSADIDEIKKHMLILQKFMLDRKDIPVSHT